MDGFLVYQIREIKKTWEYRIGQIICYVPRAIKYSLIDKDPFRMMRLKSVKRNMNYNKELLCEIRNSEHLDDNNYNKKKEKNIYIDESKINVCIIYSDASHQWYSYETLCIAFLQDDRFQVNILTYLSPQNAIKWSDENELSKEIKVNYISVYEYDFKRFPPDIVILCNSKCMVKMFSKKMLKDIRLCSKLMIALPASLVEFSENDLDKLSSIGVNYCIINKLIYTALSNRRKNTPYYVPLGNPKFDNLYKVLQKNRAGFLESRFKGKKIVLWAPDHCVDRRTFSFDQFLIPIIDLFKKEKEMGLIIRLHPLLLSELLRYDIWSDTDIDVFISYLNRIDNIILDNNSDYNWAYSIADGVITDVECGITISAMTTKKPIAIIHRKNEKYYNKYRELNESLYHIFSVNDLMGFVDMIKNDDDVLIDKRNELYNKLIMPFDGNNGLRIKNWISDRYFENYM